MSGDLVWRLQHQPLWRCGEHRTRRLGGVTVDAAGLKNRIHGREGDALRVRVRLEPGERRRARGGQKHEASQRGDEPADDDRVRARPKVHDVLEACTEDEQTPHHQPRPAIAVRRGEVVRQHGEEHREREVVVVNRPAFGSQPKRGVDRLPRLGRRNHVLLRGDDAEEDVGRHGGANHRADFEKRRTPAEEVRQRVDQPEQEPEPEEPKDALVAGQWRAPHQLVHDEAQRQEPEAEPDGLLLGQRRDLRVDQEGGAAGVVDDAEQAEARNPRGVALPLEPVDRGGQLAKRLALDDFVEAARVRHPQFADHGAFSGLGGLREVAVEPHEQERVADPHDRGDDVNPAHQQVQPFDDDSHETPRAGREREGAHRISATEPARAPTRLLAPVAAPQICVASLRCASFS